MQNVEYIIVFNEQIAVIILGHEFLIDLVHVRDELREPMLFILGLIIKNKTGK